MRGSSLSESLGDQVKELVISNLDDADIDAILTSVTIDQLAKAVKKKGYTVAKEFVTA